VKTEREKWEAGLKAEREKRKEALKVERAKWDKALKVEREKLKDALTEALKAEREKRQHADRQLEKADTNKKYELLKNHLLEVEETTVRWIANNVGHQLFSFCMKIDCVQNRIQKCLTESSYAIYSTKCRKCWLLLLD
jgi:hypothetical protein